MATKKPQLTIVESVGWIKRSVSTSAFGGYAAARLYPPYFLTNVAVQGQYKLIEEDYLWWPLDGRDLHARGR